MTPYFRREHDSEPCSDPKTEPAKRLKCLTKNVSTHPPTPVVLSLEYGALFGSIAVTSFFRGSFYYSPDEADEVFPFQVSLEGRARSGRIPGSNSHTTCSPAVKTLLSVIASPRPEDDTECVKRDAPSCSTCALLMRSPFFLFARFVKYNERKVVQLFPG